MDQFDKIRAEYISEQNAQLDKLERLVEDMRLRHKKQQEIEADFMKDFSREKVYVEWKSLRRYKDGAEYYGISQSKFEQYAKEAGAVIKKDRIAFVDCALFEEYIKQFRVED